MSVTAVVSSVESDRGAAVATATAAARTAQRHWAGLPIAHRLRVIRRLRYSIALHAEALAETVPLCAPGSLHRGMADTLAAEVLPLAEACRYLERNAASVLASRRLTRRGRPFFLGDVAGTVERVPYGVVLVIAPSNYPLFLPAVQALQALVAGNAVLWKPAATGAAAARMMARLLQQAGLPNNLVTVLGTDPEAAQEAMARGVDKVVLTGHVSTGRAVLRQLAESATPSVMELSGCDAVFLLPGADLNHAARAVAFALRLNGSATCMAPRRLFLVGGDAARAEAALMAELRALQSPRLPERIASELEVLTDHAAERGARILLRPSVETGEGATLIWSATPDMDCMQTDIAAPLLAAMQLPDAPAALQAYSACPYALTASVFGPEREAAAFAQTLRAGTVLINDIIISTADPRLPFGGRGLSGFGSTRGPEGLLEMTTVRSVVRQRSPKARNYMPTTAAHVPFFSAYIRTVHSGSWPLRLAALRALAAAARHLPTPPSSRQTNGL